MPPGEVGVQIATQESVTRLLLILVLIATAMLLGSRLSRSPAAAVAPEPAAESPAPVEVPAAMGQARPAEPSAARTMASGDLPPAPPADRTPIISRMARMEARRRLQYAGRATYLDSLLITPDSTLRRWADQTTIRVLIRAPEGAGHLVAPVRAGFQAWTAASFGVTMVETSDSAGADIVVDWIPRFEAAPTEAGAPTRTGLSELRSDPAGAITFVRITLALQDGRGDALSEAALRSIAAHEFGHALGLPHSGRREDIMYPTVVAPEPSARDRATIALLYALPFGPLREPLLP